MTDPLTELAQALALQKGLGAVKTQDNPYDELATAGDQIGQLYQSALPQAAEYKFNPTTWEWEKGTSTSDLLKTGLVTGITGGLFKGLSEGYENEQKADYQSVLSDAVSGRPIVQPEGMEPGLFKDISTTGSLFQDLHQQGIAEEERKLDSEFDKQKRLITDPEIQAAKLELLKGRPQQPRPVPAGMLSELAKSKAVVDEARSLADLIDNSGASWTDIQKSKAFSGLDKDAIGLRIQNLADKLGRARSGAAMKGAEEKLYKQLIGGDLSAPPQQVTFLLRKLADAESGMSQSQLGLVQAIQEGGVGGAADIFNAPPAKTSPLSSPQIDVDALRAEAAALASHGLTQAQIAATLRAKYGK